MCVESNIVDTIEHYIFSCKSVRPFWSEIERWWNEKSTCHVVLTEKHVIFGLYYDLAHFSVINFIIVPGQNVHLQTKNEEENYIFSLLFLK